MFFILVRVKKKKTETKLNVKRVNMKGKKMKITSETLKFLIKRERKIKIRKKNESRYLKRKY